MSSPFIGEIRIFAGNFAPVGWAFCDGSLIPISENDALFNLIGTTYGGDGQNTFALPDLRGRLPVHVGPGFALGQSGGVENVTLTTNQIPQHAHTFLASANGASTTSPGGAVPAAAAASVITPYGTDAPAAVLGPSSISVEGGSQPHDNFQPYLCVNFILSLFGIFPSQN